MGANTKIEWCDHTANTWHGCTKISPGCKNCYAEAQSHRWGHDIWGPKKPRRMIKSVWSDVRKWAIDAAAAGIRRKVFWGSMMDVCEKRPDLVEPRKRMCGLIEEFEDHLDFLLLTKRPENYPELMLWSKWPSNVWAGASAENQERLEHSVQHLQQFRPALRWLSVEPLLEPVQFGSLLSMVDWVVIGGESGAGARGFDLRWALSIVQQCNAAGVATFVKQLGLRPYVSPKSDNGTGIGTGYELKLKDKKGGDMSEWPKGEFAELHVREYPKAAAA